MMLQWNQKYVVPLARGTALEITIVKPGTTTASSASGTALFHWQDERLLTTTILSQLKTRTQAASEKIIIPSLRI
jgi:hypothetical protein